MSSVELLNFLKRNLGIIIKRLEETGVRLSLFNEHAFTPEVEVSDSQTSVSVPNGAVWKIKNLGDHPVFFNVDRPVSPSEYGIVPPKSYLVLARPASSVYLKAPTGQRSIVKVDVLRWT